MSAIQPTDAQAVDIPTVGSAQDAYHQLTDTLYVVAEAVTLRVAESLPGLAESFQDKVLLIVGGQARGPLGFFAGEKWRLDAHRFHELHVNVGHRVYAGTDPERYAEDVLVTVAHELAHFYAREQGIRDVSGRGRYHNRKFAELAHALGLHVEPSGRSHIGFITTALNASGREIYPDLLVSVEQALRLTSAPLPTPTPPASLSLGVVTAVPAVAEPEVPGKNNKYVSARCECRDRLGNPRTLRMARGWWQPGTVGCGICLRLFVESPPSGADHTAKPSRPSSNR
ncbi:hypothetical protein [uncultured Microbacterium sp.]|uniref:hypothetical protein n=1 Tax=uncultured Microbacterium sp. TaxID=191216 RepID=UPI0030F6430D